MHSNIPSTKDILKTPDQIAPEFSDNFSELLSMQFADLLPALNFYYLLEKTYNKLITYEKYKDNDKYQKPSLKFINTALFFDLLEKNLYTQMNETLAKVEINNFNNWVNKVTCLRLKNIILFIFRAQYLILPKIILSENNMDMIEAATFFLNNTADLSCLSNLERNIMEQAIYQIVSRPVGLSLISKLNSFFLNINKRQIIIEPNKNDKYSKYRNCNLYKPLSEERFKEKKIKQIYENNDYKKQPPGYNFIAQDWSLINPGYIAINFFRVENCPEESWSKLIINAINSTLNNKILSLGRNGGYAYSPFFVGPAHELIHYLHFVKARSRFNLKFGSKDGFLKKVFTNVEEFYTILLGKITGNMILKEQGLNQEISHLGFDYSTKSQTMIYSTLNNKNVTYTIPDDINIFLNNIRDALRQDSSAMQILERNDPDFYKYVTQCK